MEKIRAIALDMDGVLTDGTFWWSADGGETKRFSFRDVMGISVGKKAGLIFAIISGENTPQVSRYAEKMKIEHVFAGCKDKASALREFSGKVNIPLEQMSFMGDDINDLSAMDLVAFSAAPSDAHESVLVRARFISKHPGGNGAVRELIDTILKTKE